MELTATTINNPVKYYTLDPPYKKYVALLTQTGTTAPVATVLENTIGDIVWEYNGIGAYRAIISGFYFDPNKTVVYGNSRYAESTLTFNVYGGFVEVISGYTVDGSYSNDYFQPASIEIRVYN
jgi:hypothetical protein